MFNASDNRKKNLMLRICREYKAFRACDVMYIIMNSKNIIDAVKEIVYLIAYRESYDILLYQYIVETIFIRHSKTIKKNR